MDNLIRRSMHEAVDDLEPSASVREALLAQAAATAGQSSALGPTVPALADGLCENAGHDNRTRPDPEIAISARHRQWLLMTTAAGAVR